MLLIDWLNKTIIKHKGRGNVIPIKNDLLGFCEGDYPTAALLTQLLYWKDKTKVNGDWIAKSAKDWQKELYLSQKQISRITKKLTTLRLIETKIKRFSGSPTTHYRLRDTELKKRFVEYLETGVSIFAKSKNPIGQNIKMDSNKSYQLNAIKGKNPIEQNVIMDSAKTVQSITETTTEPIIDITSKKATEHDFSFCKKADFDNIQTEDITSAVIPKEKSCGKKEKVMIQLPFESDNFQEIWKGWNTYLFKKFSRVYSTLEEQAALMPLQNYNEAFSINLITKAISSGWRSFQFDDTSEKYENYLIIKTNNNDTSSNESFRNKINKISNDAWSRFDEI